MKIAHEKRKDIFTHAIAFGKPASTQDNEKKKQNIIAKKNNRVALHDIGLYLRNWWFNDSQNKIHKTEKQIH